LYRCSPHLQYVIARKQDSVNPASCVVFKLAAFEDALPFSAVYYLSARMPAAYQTNSNLHILLPYQMLVICTNRSILSCSDIRKTQFLAYAFVLTYKKYCAMYHTPSSPRCHTLTNPLPINTHKMNLPLNETSKKLWFHYFGWLTLKLR
jgi:hypothetical protein